ncbi:MAG: flippase-like domain-containing protein [Chloroflexi bacterium]|nr:flippase-like domain-containing protein [Chloroflexota bacterium]
MNVQNLRGKLLLSLLLAIVVYGGVSFFVDYRDVGRSMGDFNWALLPLILLLSSLNYVFRFVKWQYYLNIIGVRGLSTRNSMLIFFSGLGMVITPGKVGEWLKSYLLREVHGTPITRSAPILIAERLTDSIALLIIGSAGVFVFRNSWWAFVVVAIGSVLFIFVARHRPTVMLLLRLGARLPLVGRFVPQLEQFYESTYLLLSPRALVAMTALSAFSWFFEVLGFYFTLIGLGLSHDGELLLQATFILPIATLASAILLTPGGLGVAEGALVTLTVALVDVSKSAAAVATFIIRFGTLWFGVIVGLIAFAILSRQLGERGDAEPVSPAATAESPP